MAQKIVTSFIDDIDGSEAEGTVRFGLDGTDYEIDLNAAHDNELRGVLAQYVDAARRITASVRTAGHGRRDRRSPQAAAGGVPSEEVRAWAKRRGIEISDRGRIPRAVIAEFSAARQNGSTTAVVPSPEEWAEQQLAANAIIPKEAAAPPAVKRPSRKPKEAADTAPAEPPKAAARGGRRTKPRESATA
jgi:hypothetical protein